MRSTRLLVLAAALAASGCFAYVPSSPQELVPGEGVRLRLSAQEAMKYADLRLADARSLEGKFVDRSDAELMVEATVGTSDRERGTQLLLQRVTVPLTGIVDVQKKKLDTFKTGLLVGAGTAAVAAVIFQDALGYGSDETPPTENPEARRIPILRFAFPLGGR
ncbi:MAG: hypothetical protein FIA95_11925 [Gemmatimonadetes bacterium]|nr:hypothetical protein [Gemmatimonadota bacterium]